MDSSKKTKSKVKEPSTMAVKRAYDHIRQMTVDFSFRPGDQINEIEIANHLMISRVPVREALNRLVVGGYVTFDHGKGFYCRRFSESEIKNLYGVRRDLEIGAVQQACQVGGDGEIVSIIAEWEKVAGTHKEMTIEQIIGLDETFHLNIANLSANAERVAVLLNIYDRIRFVRCIHIENDNRRNAFVEEHLELIYAVQKRDLAVSAKLMDSHLGTDSKELAENIRTGMLRIYANDIM